MDKNLTNLAKTLLNPQMIKCADVPFLGFSFEKQKQIIFGLIWFSWPLVEIATKLVSDVVHLGSVLSQASELSKVVRCRSGTVTHGVPENTWTRTS